MPKTKDQKRQIIKDLSDKISKAKSIIFVNFNCLTVKENEELRNLLRKEQSEYFVAKKTLFKIALGEKAAGAEIKNFNGRIAAIFGYADEAAPAKATADFQKNKAGKIEFMGGILENKFIGANEAAALSKIPSRSELYAKIAESLNAPVSGFVNALAGNLRNLVYVLKAIEEKK